MEVSIEPHAAFPPFGVKLFTKLDTLIWCKRTYNVDGGHTTHRVDLHIQRSHPVSDDVILTILDLSSLNSRRAASV